MLFFGARHLVSASFALTESSEAVGKLVLGLRVYENLGQNDTVKVTNARACCQFIL